jgi:hypothetical protein
VRPEGVAKRGVGPFVAGSKSDRGAEVGDCLIQHSTGLQDGTMLMRRRPMPIHDWTYMASWDVTPKPIRDLVAPPEAAV